MSNTGALKYGTRNLPRGHAAGIQAQSQDIADAALNARKLSDRHLYLKFRTAPHVQSKLNTGVAPTGVAGDVNNWHFPTGTLEQHVLGTQTIIVPVIAAGGLLASLDKTDNDGLELCPGITARCPVAFTIGTDPAFYTRLKFTLADVSGTDDCFVGFRKTQAYGPLDDYTDFAGLNVILGDINIETALNNAATTTTDTTNNWADTEAHELKVLVSAGGVVTYQIDGAAPTTVAAFTFDATDVVVPCFYFLHATTSPTDLHLDYWETGFQAGTG